MKEEKKVHCFYIVSEFINKETIEQIILFLNKIEQAVHFPLGKIICLMYPLKKAFTCPNVHQETVKA